MKNSILLTLIFLLFSVNIFAQETDSTKTRFAQVSLIAPIGSNGLQSTKITNNVSLNVMCGFNGGLNGIEVGTILNYNKGGLRGLQTVGIMNLNAGDVRGVLFSGVSNICLDSTRGLLFSGILNYSGKNAKGLFTAPLNIAGGEFKGLQLGVVNFAKKLKGTQLGVINLGGVEERGTPIGLFNFVKNGYYALEFAGGEALYSNLSFKMGVEHFYTIYKVGLGSYNNKPLYSYGLGFGKNIQFSENQKLSVDLTGSNLVYDNNWSGNINILSKLGLNYKHHFTERLALLVGPSINVYLSKVNIEGDYGTLNVPYTLHSNEWSAGKISSWIGANAGISLKL